jgi:hypothetical protein
MSRSIWKSAAWFALIGPLVGAAVALCLLLASFVYYVFFARDEYTSLAENFLALLADALIILFAAYPIGGPGAFAAGATMELLSRRADRRGSSAAALLVGAAISMLVVYGLDEFVLPHPHGDAAPAFGPTIWLLAGGVGGLSAAICCYVSSRRRAGSATAPSTNPDLNP